MTDKTAALAVALLFASVLTAAAQPTAHPIRAQAFVPGNRSYQSELPRRNDHQNCYLPSDACDTEHSVTN
jgi:hypothetical protein